MGLHGKGETGWIRGGKSGKLATTLNEARSSPPPPPPPPPLEGVARRGGNDKAAGASQIRVARQRYPIRELFNKPELAALAAR